MRDGKQPVDFVIRMLGVSVGEAELKKRLGVSLDRYEALPGTSLFYAQVCDPHGSGGWTSAAKLLANVGPAIGELIENRAIESAAIDVSVHFADNMAAVSSKIPARIAELAGQNQIDIDVSAYLTHSE